MGQIKNIFNRVGRRLLRTKWLEPLLNEFVEENKESTLLFSNGGDCGTKNLITREMWLESTLSNIPHGSRILDAGAGELKYKPLCSHLNYVGQDFAKYDGKGDGSGLQAGNWSRSGLDIVSDITSIPEPSESFDAIMCIEVFEHIPDPISAIKEFSRLLKPEGQLIITAPFCSLTHFAPYHFYTGFNSYFYKAHLQAFGFEIIDMQANGNYFEYLAQEIRRLPEVADRYCHMRSHRRESVAIKIILRMLERFALRDNGSSELLNHGYHVRAIKTLSPIVKAQL